MRHKCFLVMALVCCLFFTVKANENAKSSAAADEINRMATVEAYADLIDKLYVDLNISKADLEENVEWKLLEARDLSSDFDRSANMKFIEYKLEFRFKNELLHWYNCVEKDEKGLGYVGFHIDKLPILADKYDLKNEKAVLHVDYKPLAEFWKGHVLYRPVPGADETFFVYGRLKFKQTIDGWESVGVHGVHLKIDDKFHEMRFSDNLSSGMIFKNKLSGKFSGKILMLMDSEEHRNLLQAYDREFAAARNRFLDRCKVYNTAIAKKRSTSKEVREATREYNRAAREKNKAEIELKKAVNRRGIVAKKLKDSEERLNKFMNSNQKDKRKRSFDRLSDKVSQCQQELAQAEQEVTDAQMNLAQKRTDFAKCLSERDATQKAKVEAEENFKKIVPPWQPLGD